MFRNLLVFILLFISALQAQDTSRLTTANIVPLMQQLMDQHIDKREVTPELLRNGIRKYIDQADPERLYLLEAEAAPFLNPSDQDLKGILQQYRRGQFDYFYRLNAQLQEGIKRAQTYRTMDDSDFTVALRLAERGDYDNIEREEDGRPRFAQSTEELKERWRDRIVRMLAFDIQRYGANEVHQYRKDELGNIEQSLRPRERSYLYLDASNQPLPSQDQQHLVALHILKALAGSLDAHTAFFDDTEAFDMKTQLDKGFKGIGIVFGKALNGFIVSSIIPDSPAAKSGKVAAKDVIVAINGAKLEGKALDQVIDLVRNHHDKPIVLTLRTSASNELVEVSLQPVLITLNAERVETSFERYKDGIIGKIVLHSFYEAGNGVTSVEDVSKAIEELRREGPIKGLILDLRDNGGGYLSQAVKVAGLFITNGVVVISKYNDGQAHFYRDLDGKTFYDGPLLVLTSRYTASAAEIVAQALQDYGVALVVGDDQTYGKGTIQAQTVTDGRSSSYFKVTVGKYYTVSGKSTQMQGVKADIVVPGLYSQLAIGESHLSQTLTSDTIPSAYSDALQDLEPSVRNWYLKFYAPTLQHQTQQWRDQLPILKDRSAKRLASNRDYQQFLQALQNHTGVDIENGKLRQDFQMIEAINIIKDIRSNQGTVVLNR